MRTKVRKSSKYGQVANIAVGYVIFKYKIYTYKKLKYKAIYNICYYNIIIIYINFFNNF